MTLDEMVEKRWFRPAFILLVIVIDVLIIWGTIEPYSRIA